MRQLQPTHWLPWTDLPQYFLSKSNYQRNSSNHRLTVWTKRWTCVTSFFSKDSYLSWNLFSISCKRRVKTTNITDYKVRVYASKLANLKTRLPKWPNFKKAGRKELPNPLKQIFNLSKHFTSQFLSCKVRWLNVNMTVLSTSRRAKMKLIL